MTSPRSRSVAEKVATTVPRGDDSTTVFSKLYALNTGAQSFSPVSVTVTCTRHRYVTALTAAADRPAREPTPPLLGAPVGGE